MNGALLLNERIFYSQLQHALFFGSHMICVHVCGSSVSFIIYLRIEVVRIQPIESGFSTWS
jgi:hypothetical protein